MEGGVHVLTCIHMQARLVRYNEFFVSVNMTLDEASALVAAMDVAKGHVPADVLPAVTQFQQELEACLARAVELQDNT
jgi:hypothetical protein